jgi:hypothetical protein
VVHQCASNQLRVGPQGALLEPAASNLFVYSEQIDTWSTLNATFTPDATTAPDATATADAVNYFGTTQAWDIIFQGTFTGGLTWSCWLKWADGASHDIFVSWDYGLAKKVTITPAGAWQRYMAQVSPAGDNVHLGNQELLSSPSAWAARSLYVWGCQLENGPVATSYIPTDATAATRNADVLTMAADIPARYGGRWCRGGTWTPVGTWAQIGTLWSAGSGANSASLGASGSNLVLTVTDSASGTKTITYALASIAAGSRRIFACTNGGTLGLYVDGVPVGTPAGAGTGVISTAPTLSLGTDTLAALRDWKSCRVGSPRWDCR